MSDYYTLPAGNPPVPEGACITGSPDDYNASEAPVLFPPLPAEKLTCGIEFLTDFWKEKYLQEYIRNGARLSLSPGVPGAEKPIFCA